MTNPESYAVAIGIVLNEGPFFESNISLVTVPIMIESDSDYVQGAKRTINS